MSEGVPLPLCRNLCVAQRANLVGIHPRYCCGGLMYAVASATAGASARGRALLCEALFAVALLALSLPHPLSLFHLWRTCERIPDAGEEKKAPQNINKI